MNRLILAGTAFAAIAFIWLLVARPKPAPTRGSAILAIASNESDAADTSEMVPAPSRLPAISRATTNPRPDAPAKEESRAHSSAPDDATLFRQMLDVTISPHTSFAQKQTAWQRLRQSGKLDDAIVELEENCRNHPASAENPAALGQAYLHKCATSVDVREQGILAMKADQVFDTALALDPAHWEAGFFKATSLSYWPAEMNRGPEVLQRLTQLIEQQEAVASQPHFAQSYLWLGEQYRKSGRTDYADQVWQRGAALFPSHQALQQKITAR